MWLRNFMHSLVERPSTMYYTYSTTAPCFMKNAFVSGSWKSQTLPSSLPLPASFFKVLPLPQKFSRFRFQLSLPHPWLKHAVFFQIKNQWCNRTLKNQYDVISVTPSLLRHRKNLTQITSQDFSFWAPPNQDFWLHR